MDLGGCLRPALGALAAEQQNHPESALRSCPGPRLPWDPTSPTGRKVGQQSRTAVALGHLGWCRALSHTWERLWSLSLGSCTHPSHCCLFQAGLQSRQLCSSRHCCCPGSAASPSVARKTPETPGQPGRSGAGHSSARRRGRAQRGAQAVKGEVGLAGVTRAEPARRLPGDWPPAVLTLSCRAAGPRAQARVQPFSEVGHQSRLRLVWRWPPLPSQVLHLSAPGLSITVALLVGGSWYCVPLTAVPGVGSPSELASSGRGAVHNLTR